MKLSRRQKFLLIAIVSVAISFGVVGAFYYSSIPKPETRYDFNGTEFEFRGDLRAASGIPVYPDEESILNAVWNPEIQTISLAFPNSSTPEDNAAIAVNAFEITYKLGVSYGKFNWLGINFVPNIVESFENLTSTDEVLTIALVPPSAAGSTSVEMKEGVVHINGRTPQELDLATIRFLMAALRIKL